MVGSFSVSLFGLNAAMAAFNPDESFQIDDDSLSKSAILIFHTQWKKLRKADLLRESSSEGEKEEGGKIGKIYINFPFFFFSHFIP